MKNILTRVRQVLTALILVFAVLVMVFTVVSVNTVGRQDANLFGYKPYIVLSDSMRDTFQVGDIAVSRVVAPAELEPGDIVTFRSADPSAAGAVVTHKIREITTVNGSPAFITYGTSTGENDAAPVPFENVLGEYAFRLPKLGYFFQFLRTPLGYVVVILIPFLLLIGLQASRFLSLLRQYKAEQMDELAAQRQELAGEREKLRRMQTELEQLRAQVQAEAAGKTADDAPTDGNEKTEAGE